MPNQSNLKPFKKNDPRINRGGRPHTYDLIHEIATRLCAEPADLEDNPEGLSQLEAIMREWLTSKSFQKQLAVIQYAYGKIPEKLEIEKKEPNNIIIEWTDSYPADYDASEWKDGNRIMHVGYDGPNWDSDPVEEEDHHRPRLLPDPDDEEEENGDSLYS